MKVLIGAGNGGVGQGLIKAVSKRYPDAEIIATFRSSRPEKTSAAVQWYQADLTNSDSVAQLAKSVTQVDWLINCAGFLHQQSDNGFQGPEKSIRQFEPDFFLHNIQLNTLPTLLLAQHFSLALKKSTHGIFAAVSAKVGSIEDNQLGGWYSYRASKAALNMALKTLSIEWQRSHKHLCVAALHPGTTDTGLSDPFQKNVPEGKLFAPEQTGHYLLNVLEQLTPDQTGSFLSWNGEKLPW
ncbi:SDR family oxidoreductase [Oceanospirillum sp.]|uniref:SDR family oxidoreductase n=1 Tax=Oceanospirillum sp. TaxID=2021254 RepID=UPI003A90D19A